MSTTLGTTTLRVVDPATGSDLLDLSTATAMAGYLLSLDVGFPDVRSSTVPVPAAHGVVDTTQWVGGRTVTAVVTAPQAPYADDAVDALAAAANPALRVWLYVQRPNWATERRVLARGQSFTCPPGSSRTAQIEWFAGSGIFESATLQTVVISALSGVATVGRVFPDIYPRNYGAGLVTGGSNVTVGGTMPVSPVVSVYGPCTDPVIELFGTGQIVGFTGITINAGSFLQVDFANYTALMNADPLQSFYSQLDFVNTEWWTMPPGPQQIVFTPKTSSVGCQAVVTWRDRTI